MQTGSPLRIARSWLAWWLLLAGLSLLLADTASPPELVAAAAAGAIGATGAVLVRTQRRTLLRPRARWLAGARRPVVGVATDLVPLVRALVSVGILRRPSRSGFVELPYARTAESPGDAAHRALTEGLGSLAPNTLVVDIDGDRGVLTAHQLRVGDDPAADALPLGR